MEKRLVRSPAFVCVCVCLFAPPPNNNFEPIVIFLCQFPVLALMETNIYNHYFIKS
jgi:hypothetical protein